MTVKSLFRFVFRVGFDVFILSAGYAVIFGIIGSVLTIYLVGLLHPEFDTTDSDLQPLLCMSLFMGTWLGLMIGLFMGIGFSIPNIIGILGFTIYFARRDVVLRHKSTYEKFIFLLASFINIVVWLLIYRDFIGFGEPWVSEFAVFLIGLFWILVATLVATLTYINWFYKHYSPDQRVENLSEQGQ